MAPSDAAMIGESIGHYRVLDKLGEGGMGIVYRAEDTTLGREVAIKVLPQELTNDPERLVRFEREAKLLAALNHPYIAQIHALEDVDGQKLLVMELVEGETLADHLSRGALRVEEALPLALQITQALEAAHERGIVHRDLKPANIKLTTSGEVKLLDFGLAKAMEPVIVSPDLSQQPTLSDERTRDGILLGTPAYMSPEQARAQEVDKQSDIWAFGVVLWEMLTGERLFDGKTLTDILAAVLRSKPDWHRLPRKTPHAVRKLLGRCLVPDRRDRLHDIADARLELADALHEPGVPDRPTSQSRFRWMMVGAAAGAAITLAAWVMTRPESPIPVSGRFNLQPPPGVVVMHAHSQNIPATMALSRDGQRVAFVGHPEDSPQSPQLYLRSIASLEAVAVPGTESASNPFFSPDGNWLGFVAGGVLKRVPIAGGQPMVVCEAPRLRGASWGEDGSILLAVDEGLFRVIPEVGEPALVAVPDPENREDVHLKWPQHLPDGRSALIMVQTGFLESRNKIAVLSIESGKYKTLLTGGSFPRYVAGGYLLVSRLGTLYAASFDLERLEITSELRPVLDDVHNNRAKGFAAFAVSQTGSLLYEQRSWRVMNTDLLWVNRKGETEAVVDERQLYLSFRLSPDGTRLAATISSNLEESDLWIYDMKRENWSRLTQSGAAMHPRWSPDGKWIAYSAEFEGAWRLHRLPADGSGEPERLTKAGREWEFPMSFSPDGSLLAFDRATSSLGWDILILRFDGGPGNEEPLVSTRAGEMNPAFSPDGRWLAYDSDESGQFEVYVRPYSNTGTKTKISINGGMRPKWNPNGKEIFFQVAGRSIWAAPVETEPELVVDRPELVMDLDFLLTEHFDLSRDAERFLVQKLPEEQEDPLRLVYVPDWSHELERLMSADR